MMTTIDKKEFIENYMHIDKYYLVQSLYNDRKELDEYKQENKQLKDNWSKLKEYFKYEIDFDNKWYIPESEEYIAQKHFPDDTIDGFIYALNKMQELERGDSNE